MLGKIVIVVYRSVSFNKKVINSKYVLIWFLIFV